MRRTTKGLPSRAAQTVEQAWPADQVERRPTASLIPYARNARTHSEAQIAQIAASIREWGWTMPVLVDESSRIIAGHARVMAAQKLGLLDIPVMVARNWTEAQRRAYLLADNQIALNAGWDPGLLHSEMEDLAAFASVDVSLLGFSAEQLDSILPEQNRDGLTDPDEIPPAPAHTTSRPGDTWQMGPHRIRCGNSTSPDDVALLLRGELADVCFTSPPYSQQRAYNAPGKVSDWLALMQGVFGVLPLKPTAQVLVNLGLVHSGNEWQPYWDDWIAWMRAQGWRSFGWYVWDQGPGLPGNWNGRLAPAHEFIFHFNRVAVQARKTKAKLEKSIAFRKTGGGLRRKDGTILPPSSPEKGLQPRKIPDSVIRVRNNLESVIRVMRHHGNLPGDIGSHPALFPVGLPIELITAYSKPKSLAYEPFGGAGTTIIAAEKVDRTCYAMEIDPTYVDIAVRRWQNFTGRAATLLDDSRAFADVEIDRAAPANLRDTHFEARP